MSNYTAKTVEKILENTLKNISDEYMKVPGTFTYDLSKSFSLVARNYELEIEKLWKNFDIHSLKGTELDDRVFHLKGLKRKNPTYSIGEIIATGNGTIREGDLFETLNGIQFKAIETIEIVNKGSVNIKAVLPGSNSNVGVNAITLMPVTIQGITSITNEKQTKDGFDEESDEELLERYDIAVQKPATSGNKYHYMQWAREIEGIGNSKIFPLWNGNNTVKIVVINAEQQPASEELIKKVQDYIDPKGEENSTWGTGAGEAPIGAYCTVITATAKNINIEVTLKKDTGVDLEELKQDIKNNIIEFLKSIAFKKDYVSYALISNAILETPGVSEWSSLKINGGTNNIQLQEEEVAVLNEVIVNE